MAQAVAAERDAARADCDRWRTIIEDAQAAMAEACYREHKHTPASAIRGLNAERDEVRAELARVRERAWAAESALTHRYALRREIEILLGIDPGAASDEAFLAGVNAVKRLTAERDAALAELTRLKEVHLHGCECSTDEACAFARDRDRALALLRRAQPFLEEWRMTDSEAVNRGRAAEDHDTLLAEIDAFLGEKSHEE